jgi:excisionase family DNA binding protein
MLNIRDVRSRLEEIVQQIEATGNTELAQQIEQQIAEIADDLAKSVPQPEKRAEPPGGVMTTGEAAQLLGVRSINTVKRWAKDGTLEGFRRGGRVVISRRSVESMLSAPQLAEQRRFEAGLEEALRPFTSDEEIPSVLPWEGRKPWGRKTEHE